MDRPIQVGDLVVIVKESPCCASTNSLGIIFRVKAIRPRGVGSRCNGCKATRPAETAVAESYSDHFVTDIDRLRRIPPLSELEGERTDEKLKEPA